MLGYFGLHVLLREVIFVDLALAQLAALGVAVAHMVASEASPARRCLDGAKPVAVTHEPYLARSAVGCSPCGA